MPDSEFSKMQQEALDRMREMQRRSRTVVNPPPEPVPEPPPPSPQENQQARPGLFTPASAGNPFGNVTDLFKNILGDGLKLDSEKALILMMLFVLYKNKADIKLLVALGYLLL